MHRELESSDDPADLDEVLADYMGRLDRGEPVDQQALIAAHPKLADELREYFSQAVAMERFGVVVTADFAHQATPRGALEVRCPNCHAPTEVAADTTLTDLTCSACGSHFSLVDQSKATRMAPALTKLGRFELIERLGVGGFGSVWKARDKELDRTVAIKIPRACGMSAEEQEKFFREARAAAQLRHPSIVSVHEVGRDGDSAYIVSDFVRGVTLGDWLTGQQLTCREAAELCAKIADALHHAHEQGVVHRDLKPANVMIDDDGEPHLMDFGLARREVGEVTVTMDGHVLGTPAYMSPEQAEGKGHQADRRSDVYSLGVILFQLFTGELPFRGNARMLIHQVINDDPPSPRKLNSNIPKDLETITLKCLEKSAVNRYQTASQLAQELRRFLVGNPIHARPVSHIERSFRWVARNTLVSALLASVVLSLLIGTFVSMYFGIKSRRQADELLARQNETLAAKQQADAARTAAEQAKAEAERQLYGQLIIRAGQELEANNVREARRLLAISPESLRGWEFSYLRCCLDRSISTYSISAASAGSVSAAAISQDSKIALVGCNSGHIELIDTASGKLFASHLLEGQIEALAIDPSNKLLAASHSKYSDPPKFTISILDLGSGQLSAQMNGQLEQVNSLTFSSDGKWLASGAGGARGEHAVKIWKTDTWEAKHLLRGHGSPVKSVAFNHDNTLLLSGGGDRVNLWEVSSGHKVRQFISDGADATSVAFSKDGSQVIIGESDASIRMWDSDGTGQAKILRGHGDGIKSLVILGDDQLISASRDRTIRLWSLSKKTQLQLLRGHDSEPLAAFGISQPESIISVDHDGIVKRWRLVTSPDVETIAGHKAGATVIAADQEPSRVVTGSEDETVRLLELTNGKELANLIGHSREGFRADITGLAVIGPSPLIVSSSRDLTVRTWDARTFKQIQVLRGHKREIEAMAATTHGTLAASTGGYDKSVILWDLRNGREVWRDVGDSWWTGGIAFSADGELFAYGGSDGNIKIRNTASRQIVATLGHLTNWVRSIAFSPDRKLLAAADGGTTVWSLENYQQVWKANFGAFVEKVVFSPDGSRLVTVDKDSVRLWDPYTGGQIWARTFPGAKVRDACFTSDGRRLVLGCKDMPAVIVFDAGSDWAKQLARKKASQPIAVADGIANKLANDSTAQPKSSSTASGSEKPLQMRSDASLEVEVLTGSGAAIVDANCHLVVGGYSPGRAPNEDRNLLGKTNDRGIVIFRHPELITLAHHALYISKPGLAGASRFIDCSTAKTKLSVKLYEPAGVTLRFAFQPEPSLGLSGSGVVSGTVKLYPKENGSYRPPARAFFDLAKTQRVGGGGLLKASTPGIEIDQVGNEVYLGDSRGRFDHFTDIGEINFDEVAQVDVSKLVRERRDTKMLQGHVYIYESNIYAPDNRTDFTGHDVRYAKVLVESISTNRIESELQLLPAKPVAGRSLEIRFRPGSADLDGAREISLRWAAYSGSNKLLVPPATSFDPPRYPTKAMGTEGGDFRKGGSPCAVVRMSKSDQDYWSANLDVPTGCRSLILLMTDELGRTGASGIVTYDVP